VFVSQVKQQNNREKLAANELNRSHAEIKELKEELKESQATLQARVAEFEALEATSAECAAEGEPGVDNQVAARLNLAEEKLTKSIRAARNNFLLRVNAVYEEKATQRLATGFIAWKGIVDNKREVGGHLLPALCTLSAPPPRQTDRHACCLLYLALALCLASSIYPVFTLYLPCIYPVFTLYLPL